MYYNHRCKFEDIVTSQRFPQLSRTYWFGYRSRCQQNHRYFNFSRNTSISTNNSAKMSPKHIDLRIEIATAKHKEEILQFLRKFFYKDEPVNNFLGLVDYERPINEEVEAFSIEGLENGLTLLATNDEKLVGVCLSSIITERGAKSTVKCRDEKVAKLFRLFGYVGEKADPFKRYPNCDKAVSVGIVSVDSSYRGKGIAKALLNKTSELARGKGCGFMTVMCTSHFTALALERLGFDQIYSLDYADYKINDEVVIRPESPHTAVTVYTKIISNKYE